MLEHNADKNINIINAPSVKVLNEEETSVDTIFCCQFCLKHFKTENEKCKHEKNHIKKPKKFTCKICPNIIFTLEEEYLTHINDVHKGRHVEKFMCSKCGKQYKSKHDLTIHIRSKCGTQKTYECQECNQKFMSPGSLYNHKLRHSGALSFMCRFCAKLFLTAGQLKIHERSHTKEKVFICKVCGKGFCHRQSLITHSSIHTGIKPFVCENCNCSFSCVGNLLKHRKTHADSCGLIPLKTHRINHPETKMKMKLNMPDNLKVHAIQKKRKIQEKISKANISRKKQEKNVPNELSNIKIMDTLDVVNENVINIAVEKSSSSKICNEKITELESSYFLLPNHDLKNMMNDFNSMEVDKSSKSEIIINNMNNNDIHNESSKQKYDIPDKGNEPNAPKKNNNIEQCQIQTTLQNTIKNINCKNKVLGEIPNTGKSDFLACKFCHKIYSNSKWLNKHEKQHNDIQTSVTINCRFCSEKNFNKEEYKIHQQSAHSEIFSCQQCDKVFANQDSLRCHRKIVHNGVPRKSYIYVCDKCGKKYKQKSYLEVHRDNNCEQGPSYECKVCQKKLINPHVLKSHMLIHDPEKRLICKFCGKKFRWKGQLNIHERSHTGEKPYACLYCSKSFLYRESLLTHSTLHTGIKPYLCKACGLRFSCLSNLLSHKVTHSSTCGEWYKKNQFEEKKKKETSVQNSIT